MGREAIKDKRVLIAAPLGGLCNRMRVVDSALDLAEQAGLRLRIVWYLDHELVGCRFDRLWERPPAVAELVQIDTRNPLGRLRRLLVERYFRHAPGWQFLSPERMDALLAGGHARVVEALQGRDTFLATCHRFSPSSGPFRQLRPVAGLQREIDAITADFADVVGVHIRRNDNRLAIERSPTDLFVAAMTGELRRNPATRFFLATDSFAEQEALERKFPGKVCCYPKSSLDRSREQVVREALVDLYCLSRCRKLIGSYWSSFSETAWQMRGIDHEIIKA